MEGVRYSIQWLIFFDPFPLPLCVVALLFHSPFWNLTKRKRPKKLFLYTQCTHNTL